MTDALARRAALVIGHPGHELRIHGWLERARPEVLVLTDGSGGTGRSRLAASRRTVRAAGARPSRAFGLCRDAAVYEALLEGRVARLVDLAERIAETLVHARCDYVVCDALEGFNPVHDLCRLLTEAACRLAGGAERPIPRLVFPLEGAPGARTPDAAPGAPLRLELDERAFSRKRAAGRAYPELASELEHALRSFGTRAFATEALWPVRPGPPSGAPPGGRPAYERTGEARVAAGRYRRVIRHREHLRPVAEALRKLASPGRSAACGS